MNNELKKMDYKKANVVSNYVLIFSMVFLGGAILFSDAFIRLICIIIGAGLIVAAIVIRIKYWRCPHCKKRLPLGFGMEPKNCPSCRGYLLQDEKKS